MRDIRRCLACNRLLVSLKGKVFLVVMVVVACSPLNLLLLPYVTIVLQSAQEQKPQRASTEFSSYVRREASHLRPTNYYYTVVRDVKYPRQVALHDLSQMEKREPHSLETINVTERYIESVLNDFYINITSAAEKYTDTCVPMASWQTEAFPTCNTLHEIDMRKGIINDESSEQKKSGMVKFQMIGMGGSRIVFRAKWQAPQYNPNSESESSNMDRFALKVLRMDRAFEPNTYEYHRMDAMASERLTSAPNVMDIYGFCGMSALNEPSSGWEMRHLLKSGAIWEPVEILELVLQASQGLAHAHSIDYSSGKNATLVHNDITHNNYVLSMNGTLKLSDFNRAVPLRWNITSNKSCGFQQRRLGGAGGLSVNSPPESTNSSVRLTEKVDIYGLGTLIFNFLASHPLYQYELHYEDFYGSQNSTSEKILRLLANSENAPQLPQTVENSTDPVIIGLKSVMRQALQHEECNRPTSQEIVKQLEGLYSSAEQHEEVLQTLYNKIPQVLIQRFGSGGKQGGKGGGSNGKYVEPYVINQELNAAYGHLKNLEILLNQL